MKISISAYVYLKQFWILSHERTWWYKKEKRGTVLIDKYINENKKII